MILEGFQDNWYSISAKFKVVGFPISGMVMNVYGPHHTGEKREFLYSLRRLKEEIANAHWVVGGNFNLMTSLEGKKGGRSRLEEASEAFRETIEYLGLVDIFPGEGWFT